MTPTAIRPTRPLAPRSFTSTMMLFTTPPKNGRVPPTNSPATIARASSINPISVNEPIHPLMRANISILFPPKDPCRRRCTDIENYHKSGIGRYGWPRIGDRAESPRCESGEDDGSVGAAEDQRRVGAAEAEGVGQGVIDFPLLRRMRHQIEVATLGGVVEIEGRRNDAVADRENRENRLDAAGGAEQMADRRFGRGHRELVGVIAEHALDRAQLDFVAERRRGTVRVDVADLIGRYAGPFHRVAHGAE